MTNFMAPITLGGAMAIVLSLFYSHVRQDWPVTYTAISSSYDLFRMRVPGWHLVTRLIPVYVVACLTAHLAEILGIWQFLAVGVFALIHVALTSGRAAIEASRFRNRRSTIVVYDLFVSLLLFAAAWLGLISAPALEDLFPSGSAIRDSIWVALIVVVTLKAIERVAAILNQTDENPANHARQDIGPNAETWIRKAAVRNGADPDLIMAIVFTEALQRPRWIRSFERFKGRFLPKGTYGIAQAPSDNPISDEESVEWLTRQLAGSYTALQACESDVRTDLALAYLEQHNRDRDFVSHAADLYQSLPYEALESSEDIGMDGLRRLQVIDVRRVGFTWQMCGTLAHDQAQSPLTACVDENELFTVVLEPGTTERLKWQVELPLTIDEVVLESGSSRIEITPRYNRSDN